jgi:hypothetical protein
MNLAQSFIRRSLTPSGAESRRLQVFPRGTEFLKQYAKDTVTWRSTRPLLKQGDPLNSKI